MLAPLMQPLAVGFFLVLVRCTSLFMVAPIFSAKTIPALVRMGFSVPIAVAVFIGAGSPTFAGWAEPARLIPAVVMEAIMGVGAAKRFNAIKWVVVERMVWAWLFTIPVAGGIAYALVFLMQQAGWVP